ncbi:MAG: filamentous hemagglutinin N-terminal domain-containing protein [Methylophilaceae bacterium]
MTISNRMKRHFLPHIAAGLALLAATLPALAAPTDLPTGGAVAAGSAAISTVGSTMTVATASTRTVMTWNSFSIGSAAQVNFNQPSAASATLNRVTGPDVSQLMGALNSNGSVFLVNPNGVVMGASAQINLPSITINTSTSTPSDADFLAGTTAGFNTPTASGGNSILDGAITATTSINIASGGTVTVGGILSAPIININIFTPSCGLLCNINTQSIVLSGNASIPSGNIIIPSGNNILSWQSFSISPSQTTNFVQPNASSAVLNRVEGERGNLTGVISLPSQTTLVMSGQSLQSGSGSAPVLNLSPSSAQKLTVNGQVQLTPQGVAEVTSSLVNTGGLANATTMTANGNTVSIGL